MMSLRNAIKEPFVLAVIFFLVGLLFLRISAHFYFMGIPGLFLGSLGLLGMIFEAEGFINKLLNK